jgi:hypothetical protein
MATNKPVGDNARKGAVKKAGAKAGGKHGEGHRSARLERNSDFFPRLQVSELHYAVGIPGLQKLRALQGEVLPVGIGTRNAVYENLKLRANQLHLSQSSFHFAHALQTPPFCAARLPHCLEGNCCLGFKHPKLLPVREEVGC